MEDAPRFEEALTELLGQSASSLRVCEPGRVTSFSSPRQIATIQPVILSEGSAARAAIPSVPVVFPGVYWDVQVGEEGLIVYSDTDHHSWWRTGEDSTPATVATHAASGAFFIPGVNSSPNVHASIPANAVVLDKALAGAGEIRLGTPAATKAAVHEDLLTALNGLLTDLQNTGVALDSAGVDAAFVFAFPAAAGFLVAAGAAIQVSVAGIQAAIAAGTYQSPSVKVEN